MAAKRPLSVRLVAEGMTAEDIVKALFKQLPEECIMCIYVRVSDNSRNVADYFAE